VVEMQAFRHVLRQHLQACDRALTDQAGQGCPTLDAIERRGARRVGDGTR
jgi:hypothetical protein